MKVDQVMILRGSLEALPYLPLQATKELLDKTNQLASLFRGGDIQFPRQEDRGYSDGPIPENIKVMKRRSKQV